MTKQLEEDTNLVKLLLTGKLVSFVSEDYNSGTPDNRFTGICEYVVFQEGSETNGEYSFQTEYIDIKLVNDDSISVDHEDVIVYSDEDTEEYIKSNKYNL